MKKITSFTIDHLKLEPGFYVSRKDHIGQETVTTFDLRLTKPNGEPVMNTAEVHTMEHLAATYLRNEPTWKGDLEPKDALPLVTGCFRFIRDYQGEVPGASAKDCGNYQDMNLLMANYWGARYTHLLETIDEAHMVYPQ